MLVKQVGQCVPALKQVLPRLNTEESTLLLEEMAAGFESPGLLGYLFGTGHSVFGPFSVWNEFEKKEDEGHEDAEAGAVESEMGQARRRGARVEGRARSLMLPNMCRRTQEYSARLARHASI